MSAQKQSKQTSILDQLKEVTKVVADTGDFTTMVEFKPEDATTNPSLIFKAAGMKEYKHLLDQSCEYAKKNKTPEMSEQDVIDLAMDQLCVAFGMEILKIVPGYVSTEVDARLSFDTESSVARARRIVAMYEEKGINRSRILIKLATTWEGLVAARELKKDGIECNMTLVFAQAQAIAAAEFGVKLISPFVGRILDWFKKATGKTDYTAPEDPGVVSVATIYNYYKSHGYDTIVMGASFRNVGEIVELAGCDRLTIAPALLKELAGMTGTLDRKLDASKVTKAAARPPPLTEKQFRWLLNEDAMATEKLFEGIRLFAADLVKLEAIVKAALQ